MYPGLRRRERLDRGGGFSACRPTDGLLRPLDGRRSRLRWSVGVLPIMLLAGLVGSCSEQAPPGKTKRASILVEYRRSGGIAGRDDHLTIREGGRATLTTRLRGHRSFTLSARTLRRLRSALEGTDFPKLRSRYRSPTPVPDSFQYSITYEGRTMSADETASPAALGPAVEALNEVIAERAP